jgi:hypothetical protein
LALSRRSIFGGFLAVIAAPAIIRTPGLLMPIRPVKPPLPQIVSFPWVPWKAEGDLYSFDDRDFVTFDDTRFLPVEDQPHRRYISREEFDVIWSDAGA